MTVVIGTAGHIDHGKTTLLRALTGMDADRLPEERRRGLTIDIGYAHGSLDDGAEVDFVDVPGHDRLVGNMLVGVGEIDAALLVVAADDGPRAQTWEHLGLLDAMGVELGVVAITKADAVDEGRAQEVAATMAAALARTKLAAAPMVVVSGTSGAGLPELRLRLAALRDRVEAAGGSAHKGAWLSVDRAFSVRGHGAVVTGSSRGAAVTVGDRLLLRPGSHDVRARAVQVHDRAQERAAGRGRVALNLAGVELDVLRRGQLLTSAVAADGPLDPIEADKLLVLLQAPARLPGRPVDDPWPPLDGTSLRLHIGTEQVDARLGRSGRLVDASDDERTYALLRLDRPLATAVGERFVLRRPPPAGLLAGGMVLDVELPRGRARSRLQPQRLRQLASAVAKRDEGSLSVALLELHGARGGRLAEDVESLARSALLETVAAHHHAHPDQPGMPLTAARAIVEAHIHASVSSGPEAITAMAGDIVATAIESGQLQRDGETIRLPDYEPVSADPEVERARDRLVALLDREAPSSLSAATQEAGCLPDAVRELERSGRIVIVTEDLAWSSAAFDGLCELAVSLADEAPLTPAALRDSTGTSRKYVMALLEELDRRGILKRTPAGHVRGPRA